MPSAGWTQADVDALKIAIASGALVVSYDGPPKRMIQYQNLAQMEALLGRMLQDVAAQAGAKPYRFATTNKGFHE